MERVEAKLRWTDEQFKRRIGTTKEVFQTMLCILQDAYDKDHVLGGSPPKVSVGERLLITLPYYREYRTMEHIGADFDCSKCTIFRTIRWVEQMLTADECFSLRGAKCLQDESPKTIAVDVTEHLTVCLKKNQEAYYSSKKKRHTLKSQITADAANSEIYSVEELPGRVHDFELCKETLLQLLMRTVVILADSGYQGIHTYHEWSLIPIRKSKNHLLSEWEKSYNRELSRRRVMIEHINANIKVFKMMSYPYRNRRQSHLARTRLVCAIINRENKQKERF